jgi:hypothetical protein
MADQWKKAVITPISGKGDKIDCSKNREIALSSISYNMLPQYQFSLKNNSIHK